MHNTEPAHPAKEARVADSFVEIADGFWNIRGSFRILGLLDIGTQTSLVRLGSGEFVLLDCYPLKDDVWEQVSALTDGGEAITAILNVHPFHTIHVRAVHEHLPNARLYGTARHHDKMPNLPWQPERTEDEAIRALFADDLEFSVPPGVELIPDNENLHFGSVLVFHPATRTLHVDDTLTWSTLPLVGGLTFHPTLGSVLQERPAAAAEFRAWAQQLATRCEQVDHLCTAHMRSLPPDDLSIADRVRKALDSVEKKLAAHESKWS